MSVRSRSSGSPRHFSLFIPGQCAMAPGVLFYCVSLLAVYHSIECCVPKSIQAQVPVEIKPGYVISQVPVVQCQMRERRMTSSDRHFAVQSDGTIVAVADTTVTAQGVTFWLRGVDNTGRRWRMEVRLFPEPDQGIIQVPLRTHYNRLAQTGVQRGPSKVLRRFKRRWSPLPFSIVEEDTPPFPKDVDLVGSDSSVNYTVYYQISGQGVTTVPLNLFSVVPETGMVRVNYRVDREQYPKFVFKAHVFDRYTRKETDLPLDITVLVEDINDNAPTFSGPLSFSVFEHCKVGTDVGIVKSIDKDEENTLHSKVKYSLRTGGQFFNIGPYSGQLTAKNSNLDRETQLTQPVVVEIRDMDGSANGLFNTATAMVTLKDINDNPPTFRQTSYKASVQENKANVLILRIPVDDKDEEKTLNWNSKFVIDQGNENGNFRIDTDPITNEGLLYVTKPLDYEKTNAVKLKISAQNQAPLENPNAAWLSVPVDVNVLNVDEGPEFSTPNMVIRVKENTPNGTVLGTYNALDPETKNINGIKYYKVSDPGSWINIGETTGELTVANTIDRESTLVTNGAYTIQVKAVDKSMMTGNGTVTLLIEDVNDNVPKIVPGTDMMMCEGDEGHMGSVVVRAEDPDLSPYSAPFHFTLPEGHDGKWRLTNIKNESAVLQQVVDMGRGVYQVPVRVTDLQDKGGVQVLNVRVCSCLAGECVARRSSVSVSVWAILAMLLASLLLFLLCLLCVFHCTTKADKIYLDDSGGGMLLKSNTEAPGEEVKSANLMFSDTMDGSVKAGGLMGAMDQNAMGVGALDQNGMGSSGAGHLFTQNTLNNRESMYLTKSRQDVYGGQNGTGDFYSNLNGTLLKQTHSSTLSTQHTWKTNGFYLGKKLDYLGGASEERYAPDTVRAYGYEGEGSLAGSVGCCSDFGDQDNLDFLNSLGSKFKTLANICTDKK